MRFYAITESAFWCYPLCAILFKILGDSSEIDRLTVYQMTTDEPTCDLNGPKVDSCSLVHVRNMAEFRRPTRRKKLWKTMRLVAAILKVMSRRGPGIFYTSSIRTLACAIIVKRLLNSRSLVCHHYFESLDFDNCGRLDGLSLKTIASFASQIDCVLVPEKRRIEYLVERIPALQKQTVHLPNTTWSIPPRNRRVNANVQLLHPGSVGEDTYWREIIDAVIPLQREVCLTFVGNVSPQVRAYIEEKRPANVTINAAVSHNKLLRYYDECDIGLVLYRPDSLNNKLAAPNKLYEFWSSGTPVLAPNLPGLQTQFTRPEMGLLVDMEDVGEITNALRSMTRLLDVDNRHRLKELFDRELSAETIVPCVVDQLISRAKAAG